VDLCLEYDAGKSDRPRVTVHASMNKIANLNDIMQNTIWSSIFFKIFILLNDKFGYEIGSLELN
jgi:hypothetical protein